MEWHYSPLVAVQDLRPARREERPRIAGCDGAGPVRRGRPRLPSLMIKRRARIGLVSNRVSGRGSTKNYCMPMRGNIIEGTLPTASEAQPAQTAAAKVELALGVRTDSGRELSPR